MNTLPQVIKTRSGAFVVTEYVPPTAVKEPPAPPPGTGRRLTTSRLHRKRATVPYIRLAGQWLRAAGIEEGTPITVTVTRDGLTISAAGAKP